MVRGIQYCMENMSHRFEQNPRRPSASEGFCTYICRLRHLALAGVDAPFFQSGTFDAKSCHVSMRGSPHLRKFLFEVVSMTFLHGSPDNPVYCFADMKRSGGKNISMCIPQPELRSFCTFTMLEWRNISAQVRSAPLPKAVFAQIVLAFVCSLQWKFQPAKRVLPEALLSCTFLECINCAWFFMVKTLDTY